MYKQILIEIAEAELRRQGKKLRDKDSNTTGNDDAGGRALEAIAEAIDTVELDEMTNPASLRNIGRALVAAGEKLQAEADRAEK